MASMTAQAFNRDVSAAKRLAEEGPLFITHRGEPAFVLLTIAEYNRMRGDDRSLADVLGMEGDYIDIEFPRLEHGGLRIPDFEE